MLARGFARELFARRPIPFLFLLLFLLVMLFLPWAASLVGCAQNLAAEAAQPGSPECVTSQDCREGWECIRNVCVKTPSSTPLFGLGVEIVPRPPSPYRRTQILDLDVSSPFVELVLSKPTLLDAEIIDAAASPASEPGHLTVFGSPRILGREVDASELLIPGQRTPLRLLAGDYVVRIAPTRGREPTFEVSDFRVPPVDEIAEVRFQIPEAGCGDGASTPCYRKLFGTVATSESREGPISGVRVVALSKASRISSEAVITGFDGRYELLLPLVGEADFQVTATMPSDLEPAWSSSATIAVGRGDREKDMLIEDTPREARGAIRLRVLGPDGAPVRDARVSLTATRAAGSAVSFHRVEGRTDTDGLVRLGTADGRDILPVLKTEYVATVMPADASPHRVTATTLDLTIASGLDDPTLVETTLRILRKVRAEGSVLARRSGAPERPSNLGPPFLEDNAVDGASIEFLPLDAPSSRASLPTISVSGPDGGFFVDLEPGRYLTIVRPPENESEPSMSARLEVITIPEAASFPIGSLHLSQGVILGARVLGAGREPVAGADVAFFVTVEGRPVQVAKGRTDAVGEIVLAMPPITPP